MSKNVLIIYIIIVMSINNYNINGSGVMLIENYTNKQGRKGLAVILFKDIRKNKYSEAGGYINPGENILEAAQAELEEESANLFRIDQKYLMNFVIYNSYTCFPLFITGPPEEYYTIQSKYYKYNLFTLRKNNAPPDYLETVNMKRFYISDLIGAGLLSTVGDMICNDADGKFKLVYGRTINILREMVIAGIIRVNYDNIIQPVQVNLPLITLSIMKLYDVNPINRTFLTNTISYYAI